MEVEYDKATDITKVKLTRDDMRKIFGGETVEQYTNVGGVFKIERINDADTISSVGELAQLASVSLDQVHSGRHRFFKIGRVPVHWQAYLDDVDESAPVLDSISTLNWLAALRDD